MDSSTSPFVPLTLEEKVAKLCVRPQLKSDVLPRFVVIMLECALHSFLCSFAACFMALIEKHRRGELEPWPDADDDAADDECVEPRITKDRAKSPPASLRRSAGAQHVQMAAEPALAACSDAMQAAVIAQRDVWEKLPAWPRVINSRRARPRPRSANWGHRLPSGRCRRQCVSGPLKCGGKTASKLFRLFN